MTSSKHDVRGHFSARATEWAACYAVPQPGVSAQNLISRQRFALEMLEAAIPRASRILDAGCGSGVLAAKLVERGYAVWGVDFAEPMICHAREHCESGYFAVADIERMPFPDNAFDGVVSLGVIEFLESHERALREIRRVLRPGGKAVISIPNGNAPLQLVDHLIFTLITALRRGYDVVKFRLRGRPAPPLEAPAGVLGRRFYRGRLLRLLRGLSFEAEEWICHGWGWFRSPLGLLIRVVSKTRAVAGRGMKRLFGRALLSRAGAKFVRSRACNWLGAEHVVRVSAIKGQNSAEATMIDPAFRIHGWRQLFLLPPRYTLHKLARKVGRWTNRAWRAIRPAKLDARAWSELLGPYGTAVELLHERSRSPRLLAPAPIRQAAEALQRLDPSLAARLMDQAQRVAAGRLEFLGSGEVHVGVPPDWHQDFKSGARWPVKHVSQLSNVRLDNGADCKVPWEVSRFHHGLALAQAYRLSQDPRWAHAWMVQVEHWLGANPVEFGINWACPMDVAIRAVNWVAALELLGSALDDAALAERILESLFLHGRYVRRNLEIHHGVHSSLANSHLLADLSGLATLGAWFDHTEEGREWLAVAADLLPAELERQVYTDGVAFEGSIPYHRLTTELVLATAMQLARTGWPVPQLVSTTLARMLRFILAYTREDGTSPVIGDADDGRLWWWVLPRVQRSGTTVAERYADFLDHRHLVALGGLWLNDVELAAQASVAPAEVYWLLGATGAEELARLTGRKAKAASAAFPRGGIYVLRSAGRHTVVDAGPHGQGGFGGHAHNDVLHLELWADGVPWLVDGGVGVYAADTALRNRLRSTRAHNTVMVDEEEQWPFDPTRVFFLPAGSAPHVRSWRTGPAVDWLDAESSAYERLRDPVRHRRRVLFAKDLDGWAVADDIMGQGTHRIRWALHFGPGIVVTEVELGSFMASYHGRLLLSLRTIDFPSGTFRLADDIASFSYGTLERTTTLEWHGTVSCPTRLLATLVPLMQDRRGGGAARHLALAESFGREASGQLQIRATP